MYHNDDVFITVYAMYWATAVVSLQFPLHFPVLILGFEQSSYTVVEGDGSVQVCVAVLEPDDIQIFVSAQVVAVDGSAEGMGNYVSVLFLGGGD